jgi:NADPH-dependent glutamate synthase beta subunit-like oxidoreductase
LRIAHVNPTRCKSCWNCEEDFVCIRPYEVRYDLFRSWRKIASGPSRKMDIPPCVAACPANICVQGYVGLIAVGLYEQAYRLIRWRVPFPHTLSLVCPHPCEEVCIRGDYDQPIAINALKRFAAEQVTDKMRRAFLGELKSGIVENGRKVAVVGAGPAGLTAAHDLALRGYQVTVYEALSTPGGMMVTGIPEYRLPRDILNREISDIRSLGVEIKTGIEVGQDISLQELKDESDALFLATGAHRGTKLNVPAEDAPGVIDALSFLQELNPGGRPEVGERVAVIGGGDAAIDAVRVALRLGAQEASVIYRRSRKEMPAHKEQVQQAEEEGVRFQFLATPVEILTGNGKVKGAKLIKIELGEPDGSGRRRPIPIEGSEFIVEIDTVIVAIGQRAEPGLLRELGVELAERGTIQVDPQTMMTSVPGLFAGGDLLSGPATVIEAIAAGKRAAYGIDRYLRGEQTKSVCFRSMVDLEREWRYHPPIVPYQRREEMGKAPIAERIKDFSIIELSLTEKQARSEAGRCLACGLCASCNACLDTFACPAMFIATDGKPTVNKALCSGCGVCLQLCPNDAIEWVWYPSPILSQRRHRRGRDRSGGRRSWRAIS